MTPDGPDDRPGPPARSEILRRAAEVVRTARELRADARELRARIRAADWFGRRRPG